MNRYTVTVKSGDQTSVYRQYCPKASQAAIYAEYRHRRTYGGPCKAVEVKDKDGIVPLKVWDSASYALQIIEAVIEYHTINVNAGVLLECSRYKALPGINEGPLAHNELVHEAMNILSKRVIRRGFQINHTERV